MKTIYSLLGSLLCIQLAASVAAEDARNCRLQRETACARTKPPAARRAVPRAPEPERPVTPPAPKPATPHVSVPPLDVTPAPPKVGSCDAGGCWDTGGKRYNGGASGTYLDGNGRLCQRNGAWIQCF